MSELYHLTNDWFLVPALNVVPLDAVLVEVVEDIVTLLHCYIVTMLPW